MAEKFSRWNDVGTGVNPFVPLRPIRATRSSLIVKLLSGLFGGLFSLILLILRLPVLLVLVLGLILVTLVTTLVSPIPGLQRLLRRLLESPICRMILLFLGFYSVRLITVAPQLLRLPTTKAGNTQGRLPGRAAPIRSGDIILCNSTNFAEVLYLSYKFAPVFVRTSLKGGLVEQNILGALWRAMSTSLPASLGSTSTPADVVARAQRMFAGPVAFQPEAARTTGGAILRHAHEPTVCALEKAVLAIPEAQRPKTHVLGFRYGGLKQVSALGSGSSPPAAPHTGENAMLHILKICSKLSHTMVVRQLPEVKSPQPGTMAPPVGAAPGAEAQPWGANDGVLRAAMAMAVGKFCTLVTIEPSDFNDFVRAWRNPALVKTQKRYSKHAE